VKVVYHIGSSVVGGAETQVMYLVNNLPPEITPLVTYEHTSMERFIFKNIRTKNVYRVMSPNDLVRRLASFNPDIIQMYHAPKFYGYMSKCNLKAKVVEVAHNRTGFAWDCTTYDKAMTDALVFVSPDAEQYYMEKRGKDVRHMLVIPNGVDTDLFRLAEGRKYPLKHNGKRRLVGGFCGRLEGGDGKGVQTLVDIFEKTPADLELVGYDFGNYAQKTRGMHNVRVHKYTTEIAEYYHKWDFFVSASPMEGFGLAIAEAMACGLPCVILDCGGVCHYLQHGKHAYIAKDKNDVRKGIQTILDGETYDPLSIDFGAKKMTTQYIKLYEELLAEGPTHKSITITSPIVKVAGVDDFVLGVVPEGWQGIRQALSARTDEICTPEQAVSRARIKRPREIVFGGFMSSWYTVARALRQSTSAKIIITYHGTAMMNEFGDENRDGLIHAVAAVREGFADILSFPHEGMARAMGALHNITSIYEPNKLVHIDPPNVEKLPGLHVGIFSTGFPWKNIDTQIIAAAATPGLAMLHVQNLRHPELPNQLGISYKVHPYYTNRSDFYKLAASMRVNLAVTLTECFGYFALESFVVGVPALVGSTTPSFRHAEGILRKCIINYIDDPAAISDAILDVLDNYDEILEAGRAFVNRNYR